jgi:predicted deacylase
MTNPLDLFSPDYHAAAARIGAHLTRHAIQENTEEPPLTMDVATICSARICSARICSAGAGSATPRQTVIVSSGVHGVEGFFGSAIQLGWLSRMASGAALPDGLAVVLVHAVNPFGFAHVRRANEDNVDLNRNFLESPHAYAGAPDGYAALDPLLNPASPPARLEPFRLKALWYIRRLGMPALKSAVAGGQYQFPRGLFFGGTAESASTRVVKRQLPDWVRDASSVIHIDLHSGLGAFARCRLLLQEQADAPAVAWYRQTFGADGVEPAAGSRDTAYDASGTLGGWAQSRVGASRYRFVTAEFGTHPIVRVLGALRAENRAHHFGHPRTRAFDRAKAQLLECFCPRSPLWRKAVITQGLSLIERAIAARAR